MCLLHVLRHGIQCLVLGGVWHWFWGQSGISPTQVEVLFCIINIALLLSPSMNVIRNFSFHTTKNYNVNFDLEVRATSSVCISDTKRDFGVGPKPRRSSCSRVLPALSWECITDLKCAHVHVWPCLYFYGFLWGVVGRPILGLSSQKHAPRTQFWW